MKLRNKKTGEVATLTLSTNGEDMIIMGNDMYAHITKLSELKDYEDYEEPKAKEYWFINDIGEVEVIEEDGSEETEDAKQIGNYFETREEAEKAVDKLKAWKRLKDGGFRFLSWDSEIEGEDHFDCCGMVFITGSFEEGGKCEKDLDLLFCTEDN